MNMQSGVYPYDYGTTLPSLGQGGSWGASGFLFERRYFAFFAELRKYNTPAVFAGRAEDYFNVGRTDEFEPRGDTGPSDATLSGQICLNTVLDGRDELREIFVDYAGDSTWSTNNFLRSWYTYIDPENPNAYVPFNSGPHDPFLHARRADPNLNGSIESSDVTFLGGSGVLLNVDVNDIFFNPFPHIARGTETNIWGPMSPVFRYESVRWWDSDFLPGTTYVFVGRDRDLFITPIWPPCMKTNGTHVFDTDGQGLPGEEGTTVLGNTDFVTSGYWRLDGNILLPSGQTLYSLEQGSHEAGTITYPTESDFEFITDGLRSISNHSIGPGNRVYIKAAQERGPFPTGTYKILVQYEPDISPSVMVPSGEPSMWPEWRRPGEKDVTVSLPSQSRNFEVFDKGLWFTDFEGGQDEFDIDGNVPLNSEEHTVPPSGLELLSPFTFQRIWHKAATSARASDLTPDTGENETRGAPWGLQQGLFVDGSTLVRADRQCTVTSSASSSPSTPATKKIPIRVYDSSDLSLDSEITFTFTSFETSTTASATNLLCFDCCKDPNANRVLVMCNRGRGWEWLETTTSFGSFTTHFLTHTVGVAPTLGKFKGFFDDSNNFFIYDQVHYIDNTTTADMTEADFPGFSGIVETDSDFTATYMITGDAWNQVVARPVKGINGAPYVGYKPYGRTHDVKVITGHSVLPDGIWALTSWGSTFITQDFYLVRIEEGPTPSDPQDILRHPETTYWTILELYQVQAAAGGTSNLDENFVPTLDNKVSLFTPKFVVL